MSDRSLQQVGTIDAAGKNTANSDTGQLEELKKAAENRALILASANTGAAIGSDRH